MIRLILKLAVAALIANAAWQAGSAYAAFYRFRDAVNEASQFSGDRTEEQLRQKVLALAAQFDVPVTEASFTIRRQNDHTYVDGSYTQPVEMLPGARPYPWVFTWNIDTPTLRVTTPLTNKPR